jgi:4-cresol dehydrogenase (hydroxylating)
VIPRRPEIHSPGVTALHSKAASAGLAPSVLGELISILGPEGVIADAEEIERGTRTCIPYRTIPSALVRPRSTAEVQAVLAVAARADVPIWPVSTGKNWGYGEKGACYEAGITMVLERMNAIRHVDEQLGYAVIEPGVTYKQLNDHLKATGSRLWADVTGSTQHASVLGNALDKGRGLTPMADHFGALCGMDVVLADGTLLETGGGPAGNNTTRHTYKWGVGPYLDGLFAQSNLGVVVRAGIWLMPAPERFDFAAFEYRASPAELGAFIDDLQELVMSRALRSHPHLANDFAMMCILAQYPHDELESGKRRALGAEALARWRSPHGVASWTFGCGLYGSVEEVRYQRRKLREVLGRYGRVQFLGAAAREDWYGRLYRKVAPIAQRLLGKSRELTELLQPAIDLYRGIPSDELVRQAYFKSRPEKPRGDIDPARDGCGLLWLGPVVPFTSEHVLAALALGRRIFETHDLDFFVEIIVESARSVLLLVGVFYDRHDPVDAERARAWYAEARETYLRHGYPPYRATSMSMETALDENPAGKKLIAAIKRAVDPRGSIAPGRYGTPPR